MSMVCRAAPSTYSHASLRAALSPLTASRSVASTRISARVRVSPSGASASLRFSIAVRETVPGFMPVGLPDCPGFHGGFRLASFGAFFGALGLAALRFGFPLRASTIAATACSAASIAITSRRRAFGSAVAALHDPRDLFEVRPHVVAHRGVALGTCLIRYGLVGVVRGAAVRAQPPLMRLVHGASPAYAVLPYTDSSSARTHSRSARLALRSCIMPWNLLCSEFVMSARFSIRLSVFTQLR